MTLLSAYVHHNDDHCCTCESAVFGAVVSAGQRLQPVWWMRVDIDSQPQFWRFQHTLKEFKLHTDYSGTLEQIKPLQPVGHEAEFKFKSPLYAIFVSLD